MADSIAELVETFKQDTTYVNSTYSAVVSQVDNTGTVWVYLAGSSMETPTASTSAEVHAGDHVTVEWRNNKLYIAGNYSNPSAGVTRVGAVETVASNAQAAASVAFTAANNAQADADRAHAAADEAEEHAQDALRDAGIAATAASNAQTSANNAQTSADSALVSLATVEDVVGVLNWITAHGTMTSNGSTALDPSKVYFVRDNNGDYTVGSYNYSIVAEPKAEDRTSYYTLSVDESVQNYVATHVTVNSEGMWLIPDQNGTPTTNGKKILIATGAGSSYTTAGTYIIDRSSGTNKTIASFRADGATIGEVTNGKSRTEIGTSGMQIIQRVSGNDVQIANLGYGSGNAETGTADAPYYTLGQRKSGTAVGNWSTAEGHNTTASGYVAHAEGQDTVASGRSSHAEGGGIGVNDVDYDTTSSGYASHAEGAGTTANGDAAHSEGVITTASEDASHAEGFSTTASGYGAHAEGHDTTASGSGAHAEGINTTASGEASHAEGEYTVASGDYSHAGGYETRAQSRYQTVIGAYNKIDNNQDYALIVGNGTSSARSNALTVAWDGTINPSSSIILPNAKYVYGKTNETTPQSLIVAGVNTSNQIMLGYGGRDKSIGATYLDGNVVNIRSNGAVNVTGAIAANSTIKVQGHSSEIGDVVTGTRSSSAGTVGTSYSTVASVALTAGTWVITAFNSFNGTNSAAAGTRRVLITDSSSGTTDAGTGSATGYAPTGTQVVVRTMLIVKITSNTTYYLRAKSSVSVDSPYGNLTAVRIA